MDEIYIPISPDADNRDWLGHTTFEGWAKEKLGVKDVIFLRNNHPGGDLCKIILKEDDCLEFFMLRTGLKPLKQHELDLDHLGRCDPCLARYRIGR